MAEKDVKLVTIASFTFAHMAYMAQDILEQAGIESYLSNERLNYALPTNQVDGIELRVKDTDFEKAEMVLREYREAKTRKEQ